MTGFRDPFPPFYKHTLVLILGTPNALQFLKDCRPPVLFQTDGARPGCPTKRGNDKEAPWRSVLPGTLELCLWIMLGREWPPNIFLPLWWWNIRKMSGAHVPKSNPDQQTSPLMFRRVERVSLGATNQVIVEHRLHWNSLNWSTLKPNCKHTFWPS